MDPFSIIGVFSGKDFFTERHGLCHIIGSVCLISCVCSLWSIATISVNRYVMICKRPYYYQIFSWHRSVGIALGLWFFASLLDLPNFLDWSDHSYDMKTMACSYNRLASYSYTLFFVSFFIAMPLFTVLFCNINIFMVAYQSRRRVAAHGVTDTTTRASHLENEPGEPSHEPSAAAAAAPDNSLVS